MKKYIKAFTLIEAIFAVWITMLSIQLLCTSFTLLNKNYSTLYKSEDLSFIYQMQLLFALSTEHKINGDMLYMKKGFDEIYFELYDRTLILKDGYQIFLNDVDEVYFEENDGCIYVCYKRDKWNKEIVGCK